MSIDFVYAGDSWALKGFTPDNYHYGNSDPMPGDVRMADHWPYQYDVCLCPGEGNLAVLDRLVSMSIPSHVPIIWVYTEPGRDYHRLTGRPEFEWIESEDIFSIRQDLDRQILKRMRHTLDNPIGLIGGLSDIDQDRARVLEIPILHASWQRWIATQLHSQWFQSGWGASDIGWRMHANGVQPSRAATFAWDEQIKEWCWWEEHGYFCHEHPTPLANQEFAQHLAITVETWLETHGK